MEISLKEERKQSVAHQLTPKKSIPHIIKYMGSKRSLIDFLAESFNEIYDGEPICDLFAGTAVVGGAFGGGAQIYSNDIQEYSAVLAKTYLGDYDWSIYENVLESVIEIAQSHVSQVRRLYPDLVFDYTVDLDFNSFNALEQEQQELIYFDFNDLEHHLFIKNYSGTYWSFDQCLWIDAIRTAANSYSDTPVYNVILSSLMFAMAYNAQSTGHYAQYRDAYDEVSMKDIITHRNKEIVPYFRRKMEELMAFTESNKLNHVYSSIDYRECLDQIPEGTLVYADPPYVFVHYSRFYHALETLVLYDYPEVKYKGRYRTDRHQSPFCKRTEVVGAFEDLFEKVASKNSKLVLSYCNTGMITLNNILDIAADKLSDEYRVYTKEMDYLHSTMGRLKDKSRDVKEYLVIAVPE